MRVPFQGMRGTEYHIFAGPDKLRAPKTQDFGFVSSTRFSMRLAMLDAA